MMRWMALAAAASASVPGAGRSAGAAQRWYDNPSYVKGLTRGWKGLVDPLGRCRFTVPSAWRIEDGELLATAPDGSATVAEEWTASPTWMHYKAGVAASLKPTVLHEDSARRLWFEYDAGWAGAHHYVAIPAANGACVLRIDVRPPASDAVAETVRQIAVSLLALR